MSIASKVVVAGFAIFSMIFGSSNIVFPLIIGKDFSSNWPFAILGWITATVIIPMTGYFGAMLFEADTKKYLSPIGKHLTFLLMFVIMMMIGPFGVIARGVNVSFGGIHVVAPNINEMLFNILYCALTVVLAWHPGKIVQIIGMVFTPLKFGGIVIIIAGALYLGGSISSIPQSDVSVFDAYLESFKTGYQTMDLLAAFLMATTIYMYIKNSLPEEKKNDKKLLLKFVGMACIVGGLVLTAVYSGLTLVGAQYSTQLQGTANEALFTRVAEIAMGDYASWFVAIVIAACCLATNIVLTSVFTDYVHKDILKEKFNRRLILIIVGILTFAMSLLGFEKICSVMAKILEAVYPAIIIFVAARIVHYYATAKKR